MSKSKEFLLGKKITESGKTTLQHAIRIGDNIPVIMKYFSYSYPSKVDIAKLNHEYEITKDLNIEGIIKVNSMDEINDSPALILETFDGKALNDVISTKKFNLKAYLELSIQLSEILGELHDHGIIHKDIRPHNIFLGKKGVMLTNLSIATKLLLEEQKIISINKIEGTLDYISPEQTGRTNRNLDFRTDLYSLGVTLYELFTGNLPFKTKDLMELVHSHIAKKPIPPMQLRDIPEVISDIILKLMSKAPEERYQTPYGLKKDLENCLMQLQMKNKINTFELGQNDISAKFLIPQKLYGRDREIKELQAKFELVCLGNTELLLLSGLAGVGKTSLVNDVWKTTFERRGYFISGKFDKIMPNIAYFPLICALRDLIRRILTESKDSLLKWKGEFLKALGKNGTVITSVIPDLELIIGKQPPIPEIQSNDSKNRFNLLLLRFISVFANKEHPLVIFLDDLQWANLSSIRIIKLLVTENKLKNLLVIGAYRSNEVNAMHPIISIREIETDGKRISILNLEPLQLESVNCLISDLLHLRDDTCLSLAEVIFRKTQGNPFFLKQLLVTLYENNLISFNCNRGAWEYKFDEINKIDSTGNVIDFVASKIMKMSQETQNTVKYAACIGNHFDLTTLLVIMHSKSKTAVVHDIWEALKEGIIIPLDETYKYVSYLDTAGVPFKFLHDRVHAAAYSLIEADKKKELHLAIGQLLLKKTDLSDDESSSELFEVIYHLNLGRDLITSHSKLIELVRLNYHAAKKAKASSVFDSAFKYLMFSVELLDEEMWDKEYELSLAVHLEAAETAFLNKYFEEMNQLIETTLSRAKNLLDKVKAYEIRISAYVSENKLQKAVSFGLDVLKLLGVDLPDKPSEIDMKEALSKAKSVWEGKKIDEFIDLPKMTDPKVLASLQILLSIDFSSFITNPELFLCVVCKQISLTIEHGNTSQSALGYVSYGVILTGFLGDIESGYQFGNLALNVLKRFDAKEFKAKTFLLFYDFIWFRKYHLRETLDPLLEAYQIALETGNFEYASLNAHVWCYHCYILGEELRTLSEKIAVVNDNIRNLGHKPNLHLNQTYEQAVLNLINKSENPTRLIGKAYNEDKMLPVHLQSNERTAVFNIYFHKLILCYLFQEYQKAVENADLMEEFRDGTTGTFGFLLSFFYDSLARLAIYSDVTETEQNLILEKINGNQVILKNWADSAPMNFLHKFYLVEAELSRVLGDNMKALNFYDQAIKLARKNEYIQEEALANELAARFFINHKNETIAKPYLIEASEKYESWGAIAKVIQLREEYTELQFDGLNLPKTRYEEYIDSTLDISTVIKTSQAISSEIHLENLLARMMTIVIENAGAESGCFITDKDGLLVIEAKASVNQETSVEQIVVTNDSKELPLMIINYVARLRETVILDDAVTYGCFVTDKYIIQNKTKSILCVPIVLKRKLIGILYLENNLTRGTFTSDRLRVIEVIASQIATSIENARLYSQLEQYNITLEKIISERTEELQQKNEDLEKLNYEKDEIIRIVIHELKNPLNVIFGYTELLSKNYRDFSDQERDKFLNRILRSSERMSSLITSMLESDAIEQGKIVINLEKLELLPFIVPVLNQYRERAKKKGITIDLENNISTPAVIADRKGLVRIFENLLSNAIKFSPKDKRVFIRIKGSNNLIRCEVVDEGPGISGTDMKQLFQKYAVLSSHPTGGESSSGLGLSIVKKLIELQNGRIWCESNLGVGSSFIVELPNADSQYSLE